MSISIFKARWIRISKKFTGSTDRNSPPTDTLQPPLSRPVEPSTPGLQRLAMGRDPNTARNATNLPVPDGSRCDVVCLDGRYNKKGDYEIKSSTSPIAPGGRRGEAWVEYALISTRYFDQKGKQTRTKLTIRSPQIIKALRSVAPYYPGAPVITDAKAVYEAPYFFLLHCLEDLEEYRSASEDEVSKLHVGLLIDLIRLEMGEELGQLAVILPSKKITFALAWSIFRPGSMVFTEIGGAPQQYRVYSTNYGKDEMGNSMNVTCEQIDFDGKEFRIRRSALRIPEFLDVVEISSLPVYPLRFHPDKESIILFLVERGHKWYNIQRAAPKAMTCLGVCSCVSRASGDEFDGPKMRKFSISGRIVVDNAMFGTINPESDPEMQESIRSRIIFSSVDCGDGNNRVRVGGRIPTGAEASRTSKLTDEDAALCTAFLRGYSLNKRMWGYFNVGLVKEVEWLTNSFEKLILRQQSKDAIMALVTSYIDSPSVVPDLVQGKGAGMVFLLHGPPGVGKTLTAETIAEHLKKPLYVVSGGELGTSAETVDRNLSTIMEIATAWKAIVLIDEADVFLQKRDLESLERNSLVSIFLRQLEYYEGLMFLTTNRVSCIDEAFRSRIDVALSFPDLTQDMRHRLWENSLRSISPEKINIDLETALPELAKKPMNGREIRKTIKAAMLMAGFYDDPLTLGRLYDLMGFGMISSLPEDIDIKPNQNQHLE